MQSSNPVLVVDDDPDWREELRSALAEAGYECRVVADYEAGLNALRELRLLALILDLQLETERPENEDFMGWKLAQEAVDCDVPIIIVTGHPSVDRARRAFREYGVIDFLDKEHLSRRELTDRMSETVKASRQKRLSDQGKQTAVEKIREVFYGGGRIRLRDDGRE